MGARPTQFKKGSGGFLDGVDGVITDYIFTDEFNGEPFKPGKDPKTKKDKFHALYFLLSAKPDGAEDSVTTTLFAGGADDFRISDDGKTIWDAEYETQEDADAQESTRQLGANTALGKFVTSLVDAGFPIANLSDAQSTNFEPIIGSRVRFVQRVNVEDTKKLGKKVDKKTKKEYDRKDLLIDQVYAVGDGSSEAADEAPVTAAKGKAGAKGKPAAVDVPTLAASTLVDILKENDNQIAKSKVSMRVLTMLMKHPNREDVKKWLFNDANLAQLASDGVITYNKPKQIIALAAEE
jgi:hypothetical protein